MMTFKRMIDAGALYEKDDLWGAMGDRGMLIYVRLWGIAESTGIMEHNVQSIARKCGAMNATVKEVEKALLTLIELDKVIPFKCEGKALLWVKNVPKHNHLKRAQKTKLPIPPWVKEVITEDQKSSKKFYNYEILGEPERREHVPEPSGNRPGTVPEQLKVSKGKLIKNKGKGKGKGKGCGEGEPKGKGTPPNPPKGEVPLTGDDSFFSYLKANAKANCDFCHGEGFTGEKRWPCSCVIERLHNKISKFLNDDKTFEKVRTLAQPRCIKCLGLGIIVTGTKGFDQCGCSKINRRKVEPDAQTDGILN